MILSLFFALIQSQIKICVYNKKCSSFCLNNSINAASNSSFEDFILPFIKKDKEIELNLYSEDDKFSFELDLSVFKDISIILHNLINSKSVDVIIKNSNLFIDKFSIDPNHQVQLPKNNIMHKQNSVVLDTSNTPPIKYDEINGLINAKCEQFTYYKETGLCTTRGNQGGTYLNPSGEASFKFNGTRVRVVGFDHTNGNSGAKVDISIDGKVYVRTSLEYKFEYQIPFS